MRIKINHDTSNCNLRIKYTTKITMARPDKIEMKTYVLPNSVKAQSKLMVMHSVTNTINKLRQMVKSHFVCMAKMMRLTTAMMAKEIPGTICDFLALAKQMIGVV